MTKVYGTTVVDCFLEMNQKSALSFSNFAFRNFPIGCSEIGQLFQVCGSTIKSLHLYQVSVTIPQFADLLQKLTFLEDLEVANLPADVMKNSIFPVENEKPNLELKKLILHLEYRQPTYAPTFLGDLFKSCKKLSSLEINSNYDSEYAEHAIIDALIAAGTVSTIKELKLSAVDDRVMGLLATHFKSASLTKFAIGNNVFRPLEENAFQTFIIDHKDTWEHLQFGIHSFPNSLNFPVMKNLFFFSIGTNYRLDFGTLRFCPFDYGTQFGNVHTIKLYDSGTILRGKRHFNLDELFPETSTPASSVKNLELPPELSWEVLRRIGKTFPNVLKLNLRFQPYDVLSELWTIWPLLKTLAISLFEYKCVSL